LLLLLLLMLLLPLPLLPLPMLPLPLLPLQLLPLQLLRRLAALSSRAASLFVFEKREGREEKLS